MNTINQRTKWVLLAAIAAVPLAGLPTPAPAQYQSDQRGDALDANRRIGDSRSHTAGSTFRVDNRIDTVRQPTGNQIVTGNVTGNRQFRGPVGYRDAREFRGNTGSDVSDGFIRSSAGTAGAARRVTDYNVGVPFYPGGRTVQPPPGFVPVNALGGGYVPSSAVDNRIDRGAVTPRGGSLVLNGPMNAGDTGASVITASPLLGVQQLPNTAIPGASDPFSQFGQPFAGQRRGILDEATVERMRDELRMGGGGADGGAGTTPGGAPADGLQAPGLPGGRVEPGQVQPLGQPPIGQELGPTGATQQPGGNAQGAANRAANPAPGQVLSQPLGGQTVGPNTITGQRTRQRLLPTPGEQTPAYAELRRKLAELANDPNLTDEQAARAARNARRDAEAAAKAAQDTAAAPAPGGTTPTPQAQPKDAKDAKDAKDPKEAKTAEQTEAERLGLTDFRQRNEALLKGEKDAKAKAGAADPSQPSQPSGVAPAPSPSAQAAAPAPAAPRTGPKPAPVKIDSLAKGVPGKGLADLLTGAEALMKEGKFSSALEKYDAAEQVAPNNPLILLGRANAELGASYFARAEQHLREAFTADEALLMGQYDLRTFFGEDRLKVIANDLKEIANAEQNQARPVFLLAYVAYNSGNERMAAGYLDLADKRSGGKDPLIKKIRDHWTLPAPEAEPAPAESAVPPQEPVEASK
jgi:hypothetical protein